MIFSWTDPEILTELLFGAPQDATKVLGGQGDVAYYYEIPPHVGEGHIEAVTFEDGLKMLVVNGIWLQERHITVGGQDRIRLNFHLNLAHTLIPEQAGDVNAAEGWRVVHDAQGFVSKARLEALQPQKWVELILPEGYIDQFVSQKQYTDGLIAELKVKQAEYLSFPFDYQLNALTAQMISLNAHDAVYVRLAHIKAMELIALAIDRMIALDSPESQSLQNMRPKDVQAVSLAKEIIVNSLPNVPTITELCQTVGINRNKLNAGFKQFLGLSPAQFMEEHRLSSAHELLRDPNKMLYEVASDVGYDSASSFSTAFKRHFGLTPKAARQALMSVHSFSGRSE